MKIYKILLVTSIVCVLSIPLIYAIDKDSNVCDLHVVLEDTEFDAIDINYYESGIAKIKKCDGTRITVPIRRIKEVKDL